MNLLDLLLVSYPDSIEAMDCDGLTPVVIAVNCLHPNKDEVVSALSKGIEQYAARKLASDGSDGEFDSVGHTTISNEVDDFEDEEDGTHSPIFTEKVHTFI